MINILDELGLAVCLELQPEKPLGYQLLRYG